MKQSQETQETQACQVHKEKSAAQPMGPTATLATLFQTEEW
jgi:hypothetical protein